MSQQNVEVVQRLIAGFNRRDDDWRSVLAELDPDVEVDDRDISLDTELYRGHDGVRKWLEVWSDAWGSWRIEGVEVRPVGEDRAIALFLMLCKGQGSGIELPSTMPWSAPCEPAKSQKSSTTTSCSCRKPSNPWD